MQQTQENLATNGLTDNYPSTVIRGRPGYISIKLNNGANTNVIHSAVLGWATAGSSV